MTDIDKPKMRARIHLSNGMSFTTSATRDSIVAAMEYVVVTLVDKSVQSRHIVVVEDIDE